MFKCRATFLFTFKKKNYVLIYRIKDERGKIKITLSLSLLYSITVYRRYDRTVTKCEDDAYAFQHDGILCHLHLHTTYFPLFHIV